LEGEIVAPDGLVAVLCVVAYLFHPKHKGLVKLLSSDLLRWAGGILVVRALWILPESKRQREFSGQRASLRIECTACVGAKKKFKSKSKFKEKHSMIGCLSGFIPGTPEGIEGHLNLKKSTV
jgi:hypothetical protein